MFADGYTQITAGVATKVPMTLIAVGTETNDGPVRLFFFYRFDDMYCILLKLARRPIGYGKHIAGREHTTSGINDTLQFERKYYLV